MFGKYVGFLFILLCLLSIVVGTALVYLIIYGALLTSYKYAECKSMDTLSLADTVKCLMTDGVFYESTFSTKPLYEGEKPTLSLDMNKGEFDTVTTEIGMVLSYLLLVILNNLITFDSLSLLN